MPAGNNGMALTAFLGFLLLLNAKNGHIVRLKKYSLKNVFGCECMNIFGHTRQKDQKL